jgi:polyhydroxyalkanoate synthesis regulator phasin
MKKIDIKSKQRLDEALKTLNLVALKTNQVIAEANDALSELADQANEAREEAYSVLDDLVNEAQAYFDERSEKWQESDAGSAYQSWISDMENARDQLGDDITLSVGEDIDTFDDLIDALGDNLPEEPGE